MCVPAFLLQGSKVARMPWPKNPLEVLEINRESTFSFPYSHILSFAYGSHVISSAHGVMYGCGDLIFSSHMIFTLVFVLTYQKYGTKRYKT